MGLRRARVQIQGTQGKAAISRRLAEKYPAVVEVFRIRKAGKRPIIHSMPAFKFSEKDLRDVGYAQTVLAPFIYSTHHEVPLEVQRLLEAANYLKKTIATNFKEIPAKWENADAVIELYRKNLSDDWVILEKKLREAQKVSKLFNQRFLVGYLKEIWAEKS